MADTLELEVVTPEKLMVREQVSEVQIPGKAGYMDILPEHAPLISELAVGEITYKAGAVTHHLAVGWGFAEVLPHKVTVLAQTAEHAKDINVQRAQEAKARAEQELQAAKPDLDYEATLAALRRAEVRLQVAQRSSDNR